LIPVHDCSSVNKVHKLQTARDKKFGELAIEEGYLTESQLNELLNFQKVSNVLLGQALIEKYLTLRNMKKSCFNIKKFRI
jgi:aspartate ammonia-lyase